MARKPSNTPTPAATEGTTPEATEAPVDLTAFEAAVNTAMDAADKESGSVSDEAKAPVVEAYRALPTQKAKNAAKASVVERMRSEMNAGSLNGARAASDIGDSLTSGKAPKVAREVEPVDPTEAFVARVASAQLGYALTVGTVPEGVDEAWQAKATELVQASMADAATYQAWLSADKDSRGDEPNVSNVVKAGVRIASGRGAKVKGTRSAFTGTRRDIGAHIANAFAGVESGKFLSVSEIVNTPSDEYGTDKPSAGAVSARLFPSNGAKPTTVPGITAGSVDGKRGATKN